LPAFRSSYPAVDRGPPVARRGTSAPTTCWAAAWHPRRTTARVQLRSFLSSALRRSRPNLPWHCPIAAPNLKTDPEPSLGREAPGDDPVYTSLNVRIELTLEIKACVPGVAPGSAAGRKPCSGAGRPLASGPRSASAVAGRARAFEPIHAPNRLGLSEERAKRPEPRHGTTSVPESSARLRTAGT
jgi:hypothetical protein